MGKSPGKWIKTLLFGKKASRSSSTKGNIASKAGNDKGYSVARAPLISTENSPVISDPVLISTQNGIIPEPVVENSSVISSDALVAKDQEITGAHALNEQEIIREVQAATKAQAAFRGYLARRAFRALKGIIRLQALIRGHLVRRQAIVTMHSVLGIVKLQALARGRKVRSSGFGQEVYTKFQVKSAVPMFAASRKRKLYSNAFVCKLLSCSLVVMGLQIQYDQTEPNSVFSWMERWTNSRFWKSPVQPKKQDESKSQTRKSNLAGTSNTESCKPKYNVKKISPADNVDSAGLAKVKRNVRKIVASSSDPVQEQPQSELEKVKRSLRKVTSSYLETSKKSEPKTEVQSCNVSKCSDSKGDEASSEISKKDIALNPESKADIEFISSSSVVIESVAVVPLVENQAVIESVPSIVNEDNRKEIGETNCVLEDELNVMEKENCNRSQKTSKRRSSFSSKSEYEENSVQNSPTLPSYMQATASAKAKLRAQASPEVASDLNEKNGVTRRYSLPSSSTGGKLVSHSPRTHRILQAGVKGGIKSDRSFLSSRDDNDRSIQVEWRR